MVGIAVTVLSLNAVWLLFRSAKSKIDASFWGVNGEKCKNTVAMMQYNVTQTAFVVLHLGKTSTGSYIHVRGGKILACKFSILLKVAYETEMK